MSDMPEGIVEPDVGIDGDVGAHLTFREKQVRDHFVNEYMTDYNAKTAAIRVGYGNSIAGEMSLRFMQCPYVQRQIKNKETANEEVDDAAIARKRIIAGLTREANYNGPGSSPSARVAALSKLSAIYGLDAPKVTKTELTGADGQPLGAGMFVVPGICSVEDWEKAAEAQQAALVAGTVGKSEAAPE